MVKKSKTFMPSFNHFRLNFILIIYLPLLILGKFSYRIDTNYLNFNQKIIAKINLYSKSTNELIYQSIGLQNSTILNDIDLWWPIGYGKPNLYIAEVHILIFFNYSPEKL